MTISFSTNFKEFITGIGLTIACMAIVWTAAIRGPSEAFFAFFSFGLIGFLALGLAQLVQERVGLGLGLVMGVLVSFWVVPFAFAWMIA